MGIVLGRTVEVQISNKTQNFTLEKPRTYFECGLCSKPPDPFVRPGSNDSCFFPGNFPFRGVAGLLAYETESFSLVIHFSNPIDYNRFPMQLGLELSPSKAHLNNLEETYAHMAKGRPSSCRSTKSDHFILTNSHGSAQVTNGLVKVTATMSNTKNAVVRVVLEEAGSLLERAM